MYEVEDSQAVARGHRALFHSTLRSGVGRTVILLGVVSMLTDISSEMVATVLPLYLIYTVGLTPLQFGVVDGIYQGGAVLVRVASGFIADRTKRHKEVALAGYGLSALCRPLLIVFGSAWGALAAVIFLDRTGKGIRTAPRDALISLSTTPERLGTAFGIHRALDTTGAMIGPLLAFGLLCSCRRASTRFSWSASSSRFSASRCSRCSSITRRKPLASRVPAAESHSGSSCPCRRPGIVRPSRGGSLADRTLHHQ